MTTLTEIVIANLALSRVGISRQIAAGDGTLSGSADTSIEKAQCLLWYEICRDRCLEEYPWPFARKFATLTLEDDGEGEAWEDEWDNAYVYPSDCLKARRFVQDQGIGFYRLDSTEGVWPWSQMDPWRFVVRQHGGTAVILTDVAEDDADLEYTVRVTDPTEFSYSFASALAYLLASEIAVPLSVDTEKANRLLALYQMEGAKAAAIAFNEEEPRDEGDGSFLRSRG